MPVIFLIILAMLLVAAGSYKYSQSLGVATDVWGQVTVPFNNYSGDG